MKKLLITLMILSSGFSAYSKNYYRFWRGEIAEGMSLKQFEEGLNKIFIPETVEQGRGEGLNAYMPVMVSKSLNLKDFPSELALVSYDNEERYRAIRNMPRGANYQKMHWDYFDKSKSKSLVPQKYLGAIQQEKAFDILESDEDWQRGKVQFLIRKYRSGLSSKTKTDIKAYIELVKKNAADFGIQSHLILIGKNGIYEYILFDKNIAPHGDSLFTSEELKTVTNTILKNKNEFVTFGGGVNRQFSLTKSK